MTNPVGSPGPEGTEGGGSLYGGSLGASIEVDSSSLKDMLSLWKQNTKAVNEFTTALEKASKAGAAVGGGGYGGNFTTTSGNRMAGMPPLPGGFSQHMQGGGGGSGGGGGAGGAGGRGGGGGQQGIGGLPGSRMTPGAAGLATLSNVGSSFSGNLGDIVSGNLMYRNALIGSGGGMSMTSARQQIFGGGKYGAGIGGFSSFQELQQGYSTLASTMGPTFQGTPQGRSVLQAAGGLGALTGSFTQATSSLANLQQPQTYFAMRAVGINLDQYKSDPAGFATAVLKRVNGGVMPTAAQISGGMTPGHRLYTDLTNLGLTPDMMASVAEVGTAQATATAAGQGSISLKVGSNHQLVNTPANRAAHITGQPYSAVQGFGGAKAGVTQSIGAKAPIAGYYGALASATQSLIAELQGFAGTVAGYAGVGGSALNSGRSFLGNVPIIGSVLGGGGGGGGGAGGGAGGGGGGAGGGAGGILQLLGLRTLLGRGGAGGAAGGGLLSSTAGGAGLAAGGALLGYGIGQAVTHIGQNKTTGKKNAVANVVGNTLGDASAGAAIGSVIGPEGTLIGAGLGAAYGLGKSLGLFDSSNPVTSAINKEYKKVGPSGWPKIAKANPALDDYAQKHGLGPYAPTGGSSMASGAAMAASGSLLRAGKRATGGSAKLKVYRPVVAPVTQAYGHNGHPGTDYGAPCNTSILAAEDGVVLLAGPASGFGMWIVIKHADGFYTVYGHMFPDGVLVHQGQQVKGGQVIGKVGWNGDVVPKSPQGCHLHLEVHNGWPGVRTDPEAWLTSHGAASVPGGSGSSSSSGSAGSASDSINSSTSPGAAGAALSGGSLLGTLGSAQEQDVLAGALSQQLGPAGNTTNSSGLAGTSSSGSKNTANSSSGSLSPGGAAVPSSVSGNTAMAKSMAAQRGWSGNEWSALYKLWTQESGFNSTIANQSSGAYGIPQALPGSKMASAGADWRTNPATQIKWGLDYIAGRYHDPIGAWAHETQFNWYREGAYSAKGGLAMLHGGEMVINAQQANQLRAYVRQSQTQNTSTGGVAAFTASGGGGNGIIVQLTAPITLAGQATAGQARNYVDSIISEMEKSERLHALLTDKSGAAT